MVQSPHQGFRAVSSVLFLEDGGVVVQWMDERVDVKNRGLLVQSHQMQIDPGEGGKDYKDEIEDVRDAVARLLNDALDDFASTKSPFELAREEGANEG